MKTLIVLDGNCGDSAAEYRDWLLANLPNNVALDWRDRTAGAGGGLFDHNGDELHNPYWDMFSN